MCEKSWKVSLRKTLKRLQTRNECHRVAVVGIGHTLRGDDGAGVVVAEMLHPLMAGSDHVLVVNAGLAPEGFSGVIRRFCPDLVLLVDAAQMDEAPGTVRWLAWQDAGGNGASTHTLPLRLFATYLTLEVGCEVALLGIQPAHNDIDVPVSPVVQDAVESVAHTLAAVLANMEKENSTLRVEI